ncbi:MAG: RNA methyltransferase [Treponema sp.]
MLPVVIILCRPEISQNIGAVCRAMANNDCTDLRIIGNKSDYTEQEVLRLALHAEKIWHNARFFPPSIQGLENAIADCTIIAGTTRRMGEKRKSWGITPEDFASLAIPAHSKIGVVFGNERTGLTDEELQVCSIALNIPSAGAFPSLNLSHAVQIICYTLFRASSSKKYGYERIAYTRIQELAHRINSDLCSIGLFQHAGKEYNILFLQDIIARAGLSQKESLYLENMFKKIHYIRPIQ